MKAVKKLENKKKEIKKNIEKKKKEVRKNIKEATEELKGIDKGAKTAAKKLLNKKK